MFCQCRKFCMIKPEVFLVSFCMILHCATNPSNADGSTSHTESCWLPRPLHLGCPWPATEYVSWVVGIVWTCRANWNTHFMRSTLYMWVLWFSRPFCNDPGSELSQCGPPVSVYRIYSRNSSTYFPYFCDRKLGCVIYARKNFIGLYWQN
jgi:hypothetical protein